MSVASGRLNLLRIGHCFDLAIWRLLREDLEEREKTDSMRKKDVLGSLEKKMKHRNILCAEYLTIFKVISHFFFSFQTPHKIFHFVIKKLTIRKVKCLRYCYAASR